MKISLILFLTLTWPLSARATAVRITISGTLGGIDIIEGPVFGYHSRQLIPNGAPFLLVYTFNDDKGEVTVQRDKYGNLTQSGQRTEHSESPGVSAILRIGDALWDFGDSIRSEVNLIATQGAKGYSIHFATRDKDNWISSEIYPTSSSSWTASGDWRQSFEADELRANASKFSVDNGTVSASGTLTPSRIRVEGVDLGGQALSIRGAGRDTTFKSEAGAWQLARSSVHGGCIIEKVIRMVIGTMPPNGAPIIPQSVTFWVAWRIAPGTIDATPLINGHEITYPPGSTGKVTITGIARFYEDTQMPGVFRTGGVLAAGRHLSSSSLPSLPTARATLPIRQEFEIEF
jgi:hypothetical protein